MSIIRLVRHGQAAAGFGEDLDPGLTAAGQRQADAVAARLVDLDPRVLWSSPLRRARETASPLAARLVLEPVLDPAVGEVVSPTSDLEGRSAWLSGFLAGRWDDQDAAVIAWRDRLVARLLAVEEDIIVFSHFVAINAVVAAATGDERTTVFRPGYCSVTAVENRDGTLVVVELGDESDSTVR